MGKQKKNITASELEEKFGVRITENDLIPNKPEVRHGMKQFAGLSAMLKEKNIKLSDSAEESEKCDEGSSSGKKKSGKEIFGSNGESFAELYESLGNVPASKKSKTIFPVQNGHKIHQTENWKHVDEVIESE